MGTKFGRASYQELDLRREQGTRDYLPPLHTRDTRHASVFSPKLDFSLRPNNICAFSCCGFVSFQYVGRTAVLVCLERPSTLGVGTPAFEAEHLFTISPCTPTSGSYFTFGESASVCSEPQVLADKAISQPVSNVCSNFTTVRHSAKVCYCVLPVSQLAMYATPHQNNVLAPTICQLHWMLQLL